MDFDIGRDDELFARQAHAVIGDRRKPEGFFGITDVHHHLGPGAAQVFEIGAFSIERQPAFT